MKPDTKQPYYIKYRLVTGLGCRQYQERFKTQADQIKRVKVVQGAGYELKGFGRVGK